MYLLIAVIVTKIPNCTEAGGLSSRQRKGTALETETLHTPSFVLTPESFLSRQLATIETTRFHLYLAGSLLHK